MTLLQASYDNLHRLHRQIPVTIYASALSAKLKEAMRKLSVSIKNIKQNVNIAFVNSDHVVSRSS